MKRFVLATVCLMLCAGMLGVGCARAARDTSGFSLYEETVLNAPFEEAWHAVKRVLREQNYDIYTRDKRGTFVAYTPMKRILWTQPRRTKFIIDLAQVSPEETAISVESVRQVYGVTLLTHPNWHDRKQTDPTASREMLEGIQSMLAAGVDAETFLEDVSDLPEETEVSSEAPVLEALPPPYEETPAVEDAATVEE